MGKNPAIAILIAFFYSNHIQLISSCNVGRFAPNGGLTLPINILPFVLGNKKHEMHIDRNIVTMIHLITFLT